MGATNRESGILSDAVEATDRESGILSDAVEATDRESGILSDAAGDDRPLERYIEKRDVHNLRKSSRKGDT